MSSDESPPTFPEISDSAAERALRRDLLLISVARRRRRRPRLV